MLIVIRDVKVKYDQHRTLIIATLQPNWFEHYFLFMKPKPENFIGSKTKWETLPQYKPVKDKRILKALEATEKRWAFAKRQQIIK